MTETKKTPDLSLEVLANDQDGDQGHSDKLSRYSKAKSHQESVAAFILDNEPLLVKEYKALEECSKTLIFRNWYTVHRYRLIGGCTCKKHLLCAMCALRRSAKTVKEVEKKIVTVLEDRPDLVPVLITMTVRNDDSLSERYSHITGNKKKLLQSRRDSIKMNTTARLKNSKSITRLIHGSFGSYEFKKGSGGKGWHPHSHEIALLDPSVEFNQVVKKGKEVSCPVAFEAKLSQEWLSITGDSFVVDVRRVEAREGQTFQEGLLKAICEASKYALKLNDISHEDQVHAYKVLRGRRLTFTYGCLWGIKISDDLLDTIEDELKLLPYVDLVYTFFTGQYTLTDITDTGDTLTGSLGKKKEKHRPPNHDTTERFRVMVEAYAQKVVDQLQIP